MTQKEKLVEILIEREAVKDANAYERAEALADHLLANGVIVPPCPIMHESLFAIVDLYNRKKIVGHAIAKYDIDCIIIGFLGKPIYRCCNASNEWEDFDGESIGKTVFLSREEAEKALNERSRQ